MEKSANQRFKEVIEYLVSVGKITRQQDIASFMSNEVNQEPDKHRVSYLVKDGGGKIRMAEYTSLKENIPEINWEWVASGKGKMLVRDLHVAAGPQGRYGNLTEDEKEIEIRLILTGRSELSETEQLELLKEDNLKLKDRLMKLSEMSSKTLLEDLKDLFTGKLK